MHHKAKLNITRLLSAILAFAVSLTLLSVLFVTPALATEIPDESETEDPYAEIPEPEIDWATVALEGSCGDDLTWSFSNGTLTITGSGEMTDFSEPDMVPWYVLRREITRVVFPEELTKIGNFAFYDCSRLKTVTIPDYVRKIGLFAFANCRSLSMLELGVRVASIGESAFQFCNSLAVLRFPYSLESIGFQAFYYCESLTTVTIPSSVTKMGNSAFAYCKDLINAQFDARLSAIPEWTFYGCEQLSSIVLPETISAVENYAFKNCEQFSTIYFDGSEEKSEVIVHDIAKDIEGFESYGYVSPLEPPDRYTSSDLAKNGDGTVTQTNTTVRQDDDVTFVSRVENTRPEDGSNKGTYSAEISVTVENKDAWADTTTAVKNTLKEINETYSKDATLGSVEIKVYLNTDEPVDSAFVEELAGRDLKMTVVSQNGSEIRIDCSELERETVADSNFNYSYTVENASQENLDALGTEDCYKVTFEDSAKVNAEVIVQLPTSSVNTNAFLYQVEEDGTHTRLQAVAVDNDGNAHFYLASVDKDTEYVIGLNVPGESTDDVIIPDELLGNYGNAVERLERIEYVNTGVQSSWGMNIGQVTWIMLAALAVCIIAVGAVMFMMNKRKLKRGYVPDVEYEEEDEK